MIYLIGFLILAVAGLVAWQMNSAKSKVVCKCDKCNSENCKCEENSCDADCKCHDAHDAIDVIIAEEAPSPYLNGHATKVTLVAVVEEEVPTQEEAPAPASEPEPKEEPKKEEPKKAKPSPKKAAPKKVTPKKKGKK